MPTVSVPVRGCLRKRSPRVKEKWPLAFAFGILAYAAEMGSVVSRSIPLFVPNVWFQARRLCFLGCDLRVGAG